MNRQLLLALILLGYLAVTLGYSVISRSLKRRTVLALLHRRMHRRYRPPPAARSKNRRRILGQEAASRRLYYLLGAALIASLDLGGARQALETLRLDRQRRGLASVDRMDYTPAEAWPMGRYVLAARVRVFSTLLGWALLCIYAAAARLLWPHYPAAADRGPRRLLPQFNFLHAAVTNDALIIFLCSLGLIQLIRLWCHPPPDPLDRRAALQLVALG